MRLLVTTSQAACAYDSETKNVEVFHDGDGPYYGIAHTDEHVFVCARPGTDSDAKVFVFDPHNLKQVDQLHAPFPLPDVHGALSVGGCLYITCSGLDMIATYD